MSKGERTAGCTLIIVQWGGGQSKCYGIQVQHPSNHINFEVTYLILCSALIFLLKRLGINSGSACLFCITQHNNASFTKAAALRSNSLQLHAKLISLSQDQPGPSKVYFTLHQTHLSRPSSSTPTANMNSTQEVKLSETVAERDLNDSLAEIYSIIITLDGLEKAYIKDSIPETEYTEICSRLLKQYKSNLSDDTVARSFGDLETFKRQWDV